METNIETNDMESSSSETTMQVYNDVSFNDVSFDDVEITNQGKNNNTATWNSDLSMETATFRDSNRNVISVELKHVLVRAYERGENWVILAQQLNIQRNTARAIISRYRKTHVISKGPRGGSKSKITESAGEKLLDKLDQSPYMTLKDMAKFLGSEAVNCTPMTVSNFLNRKMISFKFSRGTVIQKNSPVTKEKRAAYVSRCLNDCWRMKECVYIDECAFNIWMRSRRGWSRQGERLFNALPNSRGPTISLVLAITSSGPLHFKIINGYYNKQIYQEFITELALKLNPEERRYLIHDNALIHGGAVVPNANHKIENLPPYSPFLNPIESVFSKLKSKVRKQMNGPVQSDLTIQQNVDRMHKVIAQEIKEPTLQDLRPFYRHIRRFYVSSIKMEDIFGD